jgi:hypothetical protein
MVIINKAYIIMRQLHEILKNIFPLMKQCWVVPEIQGLTRLPLRKIDLLDTIFCYVIRMSVWTIVAGALVMHE